MKKFENVDVIDALQQIMRHNTAYYRNDFDIDKRILTRAAQSSNPEDKAFLWMSRPAGTHCLRERDVFLKDTREYNTFRFYAEQTSDKVLAYAVAITGIENGKIMGNVYELDYREQAQKVFWEALPADTHALIYENGTRHQPANYRFDAQPDKDFGKFERFEALPNDPDALQDLLRSEKQAREPACAGECPQPCCGAVRQKGYGRSPADRRRFSKTARAQQPKQDAFHGRGIAGVFVPGIQ